MLLFVVLLLVLLWVTGFTLHIGAGLIHLLLVIALIVFIYHLLVGRNV